MLNVRRIGGRALSRLLVLVLTLAIGATAGLAGAGQAGADTADHRISHITLTLDGSPSAGEADAYDTFLHDVQDAAAHRWDSGVAQTQGNEDALLRVDIRYDTTLTLWFTPNNMYLRGFTTATGLTFAFNDYPLQQRMTVFAANSPDRNLLPPGDGHRILPYGSRYGAITDVAGRDRGNTPLSYQSLLNAQASLQYRRVPDRDPNVARALLFFIQYVSEAARFRPVAARMTGFMLDRRGAAPGLSLGLQELENHWSALSRLAYQARNGNPDPVDVGPHYGHVTSYEQMRQVVMMLLGNLNQAPGPGDPNGEY
ncbi:ribosome-inactivating family protein [Streptomyces olivoreticuli]|uniref:ribosome-inactivating family protein n=1 Tax=Streptomyces olivoreticuli TaxID=68246 RepID=UPI00265A0637|nr:ribosome-inactivating family protein [Streptomyces olivoreticuli]WKK23983.1 ribosome-inactivating family protein [Streptomyces olivoreticuli]